MDTNTILEQARRLDEYLRTQVEVDEGELLIPIEEDWKYTVEEMRDLVLFFLSKYE